VNRQCLKLQSIQKIVTTEVFDQDAGRDRISSLFASSCVQGRFLKIPSNLSKQEGSRLRSNGDWLTYKFRSSKTRRVTVSQIFISLQYLTYLDYLKIIKKCFKNIFKNKILNFTDWRKFSNFPNTDANGRLILSVLEKTTWMRRGFRGIKRRYCSNRCFTHYKEGWCAISTWLKCELGKVFHLNDCLPSRDTI